MIPAGYAKVWGDEFEASNLDTTKWFTRYVYAGGSLDFLNDEQERYRESGNHVMAGGMLNLTALPKAADGTYPSGMIRSKQLFDLNATGFYFEARIKVPSGLGVWPAFWLNSDAAADGSAAWPPEIDIMEIVNNGKAGSNLHALHCGVQSNGSNAAFGASWTAWDPAFDLNNAFWAAPVDMSAAFHVYALLYEKPVFTVFFDNRMVLTGTYNWTYQTGAPAPPAHVLLDLAIGGSWAGAPDDSKFPQAMAIDWVRVHQKIAGHVSTVGQDLMPNGG